MIGANKSNVNIDPCKSDASLVTICHANSDKKKKICQNIFVPSTSKALFFFFLKKKMILFLIFITPILKDLKKNQKNPHRDSDCVVNNQRM